MTNKKSTKSYPMPGQLVRVKNSGDSLIADDSYGVIEGTIGSKNKDYLVCFNAYSSFKEKYVSCSGGPAWYIKASDLTPTKERKKWQFWKWLDGRPGAGRADNFISTVKVWEYDYEKKKVY